MVLVEGLVMAAQGMVGWDSVLKETKVESSMDGVMGLTILILH